MGKVDFGKIRERYGPSETTVHCDAWDGDVTLRRATSEERMDAALLLSELEIDENGIPDNKREMLKACIPLASQTIVDGDSRPFDTAEGRDELLTEHAMAVLQLMPSILDVNLLSKVDDVIDAAKKNMTPAPSGA